MPELSRRAALMGFAALAVGGSAAGEASAAAQAPQNAKSVPPPGISLPDADHKELTDGLAALDKEIAALRAELPQTHPNLVAFVPDVVIFRNAVYYALTYNEFFKIGEVATAKAFLVQAGERAKALQTGAAPWTTQTGLQVFGYVSKIDGSVQPYGLLVPPEWKPGDKEPRRLDFFLHGRGDTLSEISFISGRQKSAGEFSPPNTFVLQPYGRFCCANRYAGEMDLFEALADAKTRYAIDPDRIIVRGFSMGGASCWQFATHYADQFAAAAPGAGFTDTATYTNAFAPGKPKLSDWEQKLWAWYDPVLYAANLYQCPVVAYSGEIDVQKKAADNMVEAAKKEGLTFPYVIGKAVGHKYTPDAKKEINALLAGYAKKGRTSPPQIHFTTHTLRYNQMYWLQVEGLEEHWKRARVDGGVDAAGKTIALKTENVSRLKLDPKFAANRAIVLDGQKVSDATGARTGLFEKINGKWLNVAYVSPEQAAREGSLEKKPGLQGPIDDAFCDSFVMVRPTGTPLNAAVGAWAEGEMAHAVREWRKMFRSEARVFADTKITDVEIAQSNLVLWGDPQSNAVLGRIAADLPILWNASGVNTGKKTYAPGTHVPVFVFPNPLNPTRYIVINSGHTFREAHYFTNSQQTPKLPDWAIVDITTPPDTHAPGRIESAGFFDEDWRL